MKFCFLYIVFFFFLKFEAFTQVMKEQLIIVDSTDNSIFCSYFKTINDNGNLKLNGIKSILNFFNSTNDNKAVSLNFYSGYNQCPIYVFPNDSLVVFKNGDNYTFKENRENEWNFINYLQNSGYPLIGLKEWNFSAVPFENYLNVAIEKRDYILKYIDSIKDSLHFSSEFVFLIKRDLECGFLKSFIRNRKIYMKPDSNNLRKNLNFLEKYISFFQKDTLRNSRVFYVALMNWNTYIAKGLASNKINKKSKTYSELTDNDYGENFENRFGLAKSYPEPIKSEVMYDLLNFKFLTGSWNKNEYEPYIKYFLNNTPDSLMKLKIGELSGLYIVIPEKETQIGILENQSSLNTPLFLPKGEKINWRDLLHQHKGKVIYIDFWASWCGPCRREIIASHVVKQNLINLKDSIVFINITVDENKNAWFKAMKELKMNSSLSKNYQINFDSPLAKKNHRG